MMGTLLAWVAWTWSRPGSAADGAPEDPDRRSPRRGHPAGRRRSTLGDGPPGLPPRRPGRRRRLLLRPGSRARPVSARRSGSGEPGRGVAIGTVRGAQLAVGRGGRVHVAWNGSRRPRRPTRWAARPCSTPGPTRPRAAFEPRRNLMTRTTGLDGGGSVAADDSGRVYVAWHGQARGSTGEANRRVWVARSTDDGATFAAEEPAWDRPDRRLRLLRDQGPGRRPGDALPPLPGGHRRRRARRDAPGLGGPGPALRGDHAPALADQRLPDEHVRLARRVRPGVLAAWETRGQVCFARLGPPGPARTPVSPPGGDGGRKHPSMAVNGRGEVLLAWAEGTGWQKGGSLAWQAFDRIGPARSASRAGSIGASRPGACRPSSPGPTAASRSSIDDRRLDRRGRGSG